MSENSSTRAATGKQAAPCLIHTSGLTFSVKFAWPRTRTSDDEEASEAMTVAAVARPAAIAERANRMATSAVELGRMKLAG